MTVLRTFLESLLNFVSNNLKKNYKIWYSQGAKRSENLNCQKQSLETQSGVKSPVKSTWSKKTTILSTFLEYSLNFLFNNLKKHSKIWYSQREKWCQSLNCQKHSLKGQPRTKSTVKPTLSKNTTVLSTFLESLLNFLSNNLKKSLQNLVQSERKVVSKFELP